MSVTARNSLPELLHKGWRLLPPRGRRWLFRELTPLLAPRPAPAARPQLPIHVGGPFASSIGIGWGARSEAAILREAGFAPRLHDVSGVLMARNLPQSDPGLSLDAPAPGPGILLLHANPNHIPLLFLGWGRRAVAEKYVIGYCVWETERIPADWQRNLQFLHAVWCPSRFAADAFRAATDKPVDVVPHCVEPPAGLGPDRAQFDIGEDTFAVLTAAHLGSGLTRKNPIAAIRAFREAFGSSDKALLLVKISQADHYPERLDAIRKAVHDVSNIRLLLETHTDMDFWMLLNSVDAALSLHRAEGFGLVPAQAMSLGKVAVATGWSGNMDYMNPRNSLSVGYSLVPVRDPEGNYRETDQRWAEPDIGHAAELLRKAASDEDLRARLGANARRCMYERCGREAVGKVIRERLAGLGVRPEAGQ